MPPYSPIDIPLFLIFPQLWPHCPCSWPRALYSSPTGLLTASPTDPRAFALALPLAVPHTHTGLPPSFPLLVSTQWHSGRVACPDNSVSYSCAASSPHPKSIFWKESSVRAGILSFFVHSCDRRTRNSVWHTIDAH